MTQNIIDEIVSRTSMTREFYGNDIKVKPNNHCVWDDFHGGWNETDAHLRARFLDKKAALALAEGENHDHK